MFKVKLIIYSFLQFLFLFLFLIPLQHLPSNSVNEILLHLLFIAPDKPFVQLLFQKRQVCKTGLHIQIMLICGANFSAFHILVFLNC